MKKSDLVRVIREVVKREVKSALKEQLGTTNVVNRKKNNKPQESFSSNPMLNEALQETAESWPTMGNRDLTAKDAAAGRAGLAAVMGMQSPEEMFGGKPSAQEMIPQDKQHVDVPEEISAALTRDYSDLMKAIDKKKASK